MRTRKIIRISEKPIGHNGREHKLTHNDVDKFRRCSTFWRRWFKQKVLPAPEDVVDMEQDTDGEPTPGDNSHVS